MTFPFVIDEQVLEQQVRALAAAGEDRLDGLVALAWHLRQRNGRRATEIAAEARALAAQLALGEASMRTATLRLALVDAEVCWGRADHDGAQTRLRGARPAARQLHSCREKTVCGSAPSVR